MPSERINLGTFNISGTDRLRATLRKDEVPWDITSATITFRFEKPDRTTRFNRAAVIEDGAGGVCYYDTVTTDLDTVGYWTVSVRVEDGLIDKWYPYEICFYVSDNP